MTAWAWTCAVGWPGGAGHVPGAWGHVSNCHFEAEPEPSLPDSGTMHGLEIRLIQAALAAAGGNVSAASKRLGISRNTIYRKLRWNAPAGGMH